MLIQKKHIRSARQFTRKFNAGQKFYVTLPSPMRFVVALGRAGFTPSLEVGERLLPASVFGPTALFNAEGKQVVRKDMPMETAYRQRLWRWTEFRGRYDRVENEKIVDVPYKRYPRDFVPPPALELQVNVDNQGEKLVISERGFAKEEDDGILTHAINLFLEIFGECELRDASLAPPLNVSIKRLNWRVLPPGQYPWQIIKETVKPIIEAAKDGQRPVIFHRLETIASYKPAFIAMGIGGFNGYLVFGFPNKKIFVLDSAYYGNATYVFDRDWEELSQMSKAQILNDVLQKCRLIHKPGWRREVEALLR